MFKSTSHSKANRAAAMGWRRLAAASCGLALVTAMSGCHGAETAEPVTPPNVIDPNPIESLPIDLGTGHVVVTGLAQVGHDLTANPYGFDPVPEEYDYTWYRGYDQIGKGKTYHVTAADAGQSLTVHVKGGVGPEATAVVEISPEIPVPPTVTPMPMPTVTPIKPTPTPMPMPTVTPIKPTPTPAPMPTVTAKPSTPTPAPAPTDAPKPTVPANPKPTAPVVVVPEPTPTETPTPTPTPTQTSTPTPTPTPTIPENPKPTTPSVVVPESPAPTPSATPAPAPTDAPGPVATPAPAPTDAPTPSATPAPAPSDAPGPVATPAPAPTDAPTPSATPAPAPSNTPEPEPTQSAEPEPTQPVATLPAEPGESVAPTTPTTPTEPTAPVGTDDGKACAPVVPGVPDLALPGLTDSATPAATAKPAPLVRDSLDAEEEEAEILDSDEANPCALIDTGTLELRGLTGNARRNPLAPTPRATLARTGSDTTVPDSGRATTKVYQIAR